MRTLVAVLWILISVTRTGATTYTVKASGGDYTTIQACAKVAVAGDTCVVDPGAYDERITPANSGSAGQPITFQAATSTRPVVKGWTLTGLSYITITGFEVTNSTDPPGDSNYINFVVNEADHIRIVNNYIHDTSFHAIRASGCESCSKASDLYIGGNTFMRTGAPGSRKRVIEIWADDSLIEDNDASYTADFIGTFGNHNVIRRNTFHNAYKADTDGDHIDFWQSWCANALPEPEAANYTLLESNYEYDAPDADEHFGLINGTDSCGGTTTVIVRLNTAYNVGESFYTADTNSQSAADHHKVYNNTVVNNPSPVDHASTALTGAARGTILNNIFYNGGSDSAPYQGYHLKAGDATSTGDYNLGFFTSGSKTWAAPINSEPNAILNQDPLFVNAASDFHLQAASPAIDAGGPLTTVATADGGSGTTLIVDDAHFFQDGWAGADADWIRVGTTNTAQISSINYETNTITLVSGISREDGDPVYLYKDSDGTVVLSGALPDIGAYEYVAPATSHSIRGRVTVRGAGRVQ